MFAEYLPYEASESATLFCESATLFCESATLFCESATLFFVDNNPKNNQPPYSTVTDFARFLG